MNTEKTDAVLLAEAIQGGINSFEELLLRYERLYYNLALRMLLNKHEAEDAIQEACLKIYKSLRFCKNPEKYKSWSCSIVHNTCIDAMRKRKIQTESLDDVMLLDSGLTPEDEVILKESRAEVQRAVDLLPAKYKSVIILRDLQGYSYQEISETLGIKLGAVKSRILRARMMVKNNIELS